MLRDQISCFRQRTELQNVDDALLYVTYLWFDSLYHLMLSNALYMQGETWDELLIYVSQCEKLPQGF